MAQGSLRSRFRDAYQRPVGAVTTIPPGDGREGAVLLKQADVAAPIDVIAATRAPLASLPTVIRPQGPGAITAQLSHLLS